MRNPAELGHRRRATRRGPGAAPRHAGVRGPALLALLVACTGARHEASTGPGPPPVWPLPPAAAIVRFAGTLPAPGGAREGPSVLARIGAAIVGLDLADSGEQSLARPFGLAADRGSLLVADPDAARVLRLDLRSERLEPLTCEGHEWQMPLGVALDRTGAIWVADGGAKALLRVEPGGACEEIGAGQLSRPGGVAVLGDRVFVVDPPAHRVVAFDLTGRELVRFGGRGEGEGELNFPTAITADHASVLVVDALNFRISRFGPDGSYLGSFGSAGEREGEFGLPKAIAIGPRGRVLVTDARLDRVSVFGTDGRFIVAFGGTGGGPGELSIPAGIAVSGPRVFVADSFNARIQTYELLEDTP